MAPGSSGRSPQRRSNRPTVSPSRTALKRSIVSPERARKGGRISFSRCRQAAVLFLVGVVCALALLGYGSVLTGVRTNGSGTAPRRPGKGGQGAIHGARGGSGVVRRSESAADPEIPRSGLQLPKAQVLTPNQPANDDDEVPAKPDDLMEIGHKAQKAKYPTKGEKPRKSERGRDDQSKVGVSALLRKSEKEKTACSFRTYPPHRFYGLQKSFSDQPDFLTKASYIRGQLPVIISNEENAAIKSQSSVKKVCIDSSSWDPPREGQRPFSDGQNPSLASLSSDPYRVGSIRGTTGSKKGRLDQKGVSALGDVYGSEKLNEMYLGVTLVGNAQCKWKMTPEMVQTYGFSALDEAPDHRTLILVLDDQLNTVGQTTVLLERDAVWGKGRKALKVQAAKGGGKGYDRSTEFFDDPRLFFHNGEPYILYRQGPRFGYNDQIQNPLHFEVITNADGSRSFAAYVKASETFTVCCGRNIALISDDGTSHDNSSKGEPMLRALTWVDPVTVVDVDTGKEPRAGVEKGRRLLSRRDGNRASRRQLRSGKRKKQLKSNIHGTNGYMVPLLASSEFLGIAHFHRPEDRDTSDYALHGHHYTHALFTIAKVDAAVAESGAETVQYRLKRISNEFVFQSMSKGDVMAGSGGAHASRRIADADIIQFASGLDLVGTDTDGRLLISYGINDCEGGAFFLDMKHVQQMLIDVPEGNQVFDLMEAPRVP